MSLPTRFVRYVAALMVAAPGPGLACLPPLPPPARQAGETPEAYRARLAVLEAETKRQAEEWAVTSQTAIWNNADTVILARTVAVGSAGKAIVFPPLYKATLEPVAQFKGAMFRKRFTLATTGTTDCMTSVGGGDAPHSEVNDLIVVYSRKGLPGNRTLIDSIALDRLRDPRVIALVAKYRKPAAN